jgi:L-2-hydroxyglutarate oxidase LhgO
MDEVDAIVVGAGVVGLAVARALAVRGHEVLIIERESAIGVHTSSRNSEVIHAGLYYAPGSLKAELCVRGRRLLYDYCRIRGIAHRPCGKLIVSTAAGQDNELARIATRAQAAEAGPLHWLSGAEARAMEPALRAERALWSPSTGVLDSHGLMLAYLGEAQDHGAVLVLRSEVRRASPQPDGRLRVEVEGTDGRVSLIARHLINAAGLFASQLAARVDGLSSDAIPETRFAKGNYFSLIGRSPFTRLIYPVPNEAGLGVHLTLDLGGRARFGPDVEWVDALEYSVDSRRADDFYADIRTYWPGLPDSALCADYAGIRPKLVGAGAVAADFRIDGPAQHGVAGLVNLFGIESPGLTASLAIAETVLERMRAGES